MSFLKRQVLYAALVAIPQVCFANLIELDFNLNTTQLGSSPAGPFSVDFQFVDGSGSGDANNTVNVDSFNFGGGSSTGSPVLTGGATGTLFSGVSMLDNSFLNEFTQGFTPGSSLSFRVTSTINLDAGGIPDEFSFAILDGTGIEIPTQGLGLIGSDVFLDLNIDSSINPSFQPFASDSTRSPAAGGPPITTGTPTVTVAPEPSTLILSGLIAAVFLLRFIARPRSTG